VTKAMTRRTPRRPFYKKVWLSMSDPDGELYWTIHTKRADAFAYGELVVRAEVREIVPKRKKK